MKDFFRNIWQMIINQSTLVARLLVILIVLLLLAGAMILSGPKPPGDFNPLATPTPLAITMGATGLTPTYVPSSVPSSEYKLTDGVILAVVTVVLIVLLGTALHIRRNTKKSQE